MLGQTKILGNSKPRYWQKIQTKILAKTCNLPAPTSPQVYFERFSLQIITNLLVWQCQTTWFLFWSLIQGQIFLMSKAIHRIPDPGPTLNGPASKLFWGCYWEIFYTPICQDREALSPHSHFVLNGRVWSTALDGSWQTGRVKQFDSTWWLFVCI